MLVFSRFGVRGEIIGGGVSDRVLEFRKSDASQAMESSNRYPHNSASQKTGSRIPNNQTSIIIQQELGSSNLPILSSLENNGNNDTNNKVSIIKADTKTSDVDDVLPFHFDIDEDQSKGDSFRK